MFHCAQRSVVRFSASTIKMPPMVGVPFLLNSRAARLPPVSALSAYSWPNFNVLSQAITRAPNHQLINKAVSAAPALRKVM